MTNLLYSLPILIPVLALAFYQYLSINVSIARGKYKVVAPSTDGPVEFKRSYRAHLNFMENLVLFLPLFAIANGITLSTLVLFVDIFSDLPAFFTVFAGLGWLVSKSLFAIGYIKNWPFKYRLGLSAFSSVCNLVLFLVIFYLIIKNYL